MDDQDFTRNKLKWGASSRWPLSLYCLMWNSGQIAHREDADRVLDSV